MVWIQGPEFPLWWHNCYWKGEPYDGTKEDVAMGWAIWNGLGRPPKGDCGGKSPCPEPGPTPEPESSPDSGPNWKAVGVAVGVTAVVIIAVALWPECLVLAPAF